VSEFVFGTLNAAFVQVMYEQYLRDPQSVSAGRQRPAGGAAGHSGDAG